MTRWRVDVTGRRSTWRLLRAVPLCRIPAIYRKERIIGHLRAPRAGETEEETKARGDGEIVTLLDSPFFDVWAQAGIAEILSALHDRVVTSTRA